MRQNIRNLPIGSLQNEADTHHHETAESQRWLDAFAAAGIIAIAMLVNVALLGLLDANVRGTVTHAQEVAIGLGMLAACGAPMIWRAQMIHGAAWVLTSVVLVPVTLMCIWSATWGMILHIQAEALHTPATLLLPIAATF